MIAITLSIRNPAKNGYTPHFCQCNRLIQMNHPRERNIMVGMIAGYA